MDPERKYIKVFRIPANTIAKKLRNEKTMNMIMLGAFSSGTKVISIDSLMKGLTEVVKAKNPRLMELNRKGLETGAQYVSKGA